MVESSLDEADIRLISALQCEGRVTAEKAAAVLGLSTRAVQRRWAALFGDRTVRVVAASPRPPLGGVMLLRIKVLRGKTEAVASALAAREDIPFIDLSASGDELSAILVASSYSRNALVFQQLPATTAVTAVEAETVMHVFSDAADWRLDALTRDECERLAPPRDPASTLTAPPLDDADEAVAAALTENGRLPASAISRITGLPESTVRRRLAALFERGQLVTQVIVDPARLGLGVDANLSMEVAPGQLDATGLQLAGHPAVHGALATTGRANLHIAVWLRDLDHLYRFITRDLADLGVSNIDTFLVARSLKRPGDKLSLSTHH
jgi:DNA-binding Lrp family transcriptional regulator